MSEDSDDASKTEDPTDKKLSKGRDKGQVAQSQEIRSWAVLVAGTLVLTMMSPWLMGNVSDAVTPFLARPHTYDLDPGDLQRLIASVTSDLGIILWPVFALISVAAVASNLAQFGLLWASEKLKPELNKISPIAGVKRVFSLKQVIEFVKGIIKLSVVAVIALAASIPLMTDLELVPGFHLLFTLDRLYDIAIRLALATIAVMAAVAFLDYLYQRYAFMKQMRMTKQEVKDEHKSSEGDPQIKSRIRSLRIERFRQRMFSALSDRADVVVTNPTHYAVALEYKIDSMPAPVLVAKGVDHIAHRIKEVAEYNEIPIVENPALARALYSAVELEDEIPPEHYVAVAEVIGYVMNLNDGQRRVH